MGSDGIVLKGRRPADKLRELVARAQRLRAATNADTVRCNAIRRLSGWQSQRLAHTGANFRRARETLRPPGRGLSELIAAM